MSISEEVSTDPSDYSDLEYESSPTTHSPNSSLSTKSCKEEIEAPQQLKLYDAKEPKKESDFNISSNCNINQNSTKMVAISSNKRHELQKESLDFLLAKTMCIHPNLRWFYNEEWCRYCGARASITFAKSPWGPMQLCHKHHSEWLQNELDLSSFDEPLKIESAINKSACTEKEYLIDILMGYGEDVLDDNIISIGAKRRSWRIQNQDIKRHKTSMDDKSNDDADYDIDHDMNALLEDESSPNESDSWYSSQSGSENEAECDGYDSMEPKQEDSDTKKLKMRERWQCKECDKIFASTTAYKYHANDKHNNHTPFYCSQCDKRYSAAGGLHYHIRKIHNKEINYYCKWCDKPFFDRSELKVHSKTHTKSKPIKSEIDKTFPCTHCDRVFRMKYYLKRHVINIHMQNKDKPYQCQYCLYGAATKKQIIWHENIHRNERLYKCELCDKSFNNDADVRKHTANNHTKPFKCHLCSRGFGSRNYLKLHMIHRHTPNKDKPFQCRYCDHGSACEKSLQKHERLHTKERPFKCGQCGRAFKLLSYLHSHISKMHDVAEEDKKWKCNLCGRRFKSKKYLTNHIQCHVHQETFLECAKCEYSTHSQERLERHMTVHSGDKPFACDICDQRFRLKSYVQTHKKVRHTNVKYTKYNRKERKYEASDRMQVEERIQAAMPKKPKDKNCPKKPLNSFFLFQKDFRERLKVQNKYMASQSDIAKEIGKQWKMLSADDKKKYKGVECKLRDEYNIAVEEYRKTNEYKTYIERVEEWQEECKEKRARMLKKWSENQKIIHTQIKQSQSNVSSLSENGKNDYTDSESYESDGSSYSH